MSKKTGNLRWSKFWWQDWLSDAALRFCSPAARGVWMDLLCISHEGTPYGHVTVNGKVPTNRQLASMIGVSVDELEPLLSELESAGVFSRRGALADDEKIVPVIRWLESEGHFKPCADGAIFSRRMVRDMAAHIKGKETGAAGWNPASPPREDAPPPEEQKAPPPPQGGTPPLPPQEAERLLEAEKKEPLLRNGAVGPDAKAKQASFLPADPKPPSPPGRDELWFDGIPTFARLVGRSIETEKDRQHVAREVGRMVSEAGGDHLRVLKAIRDADAQKPISPKDWIWAAVRRGPRLIVNNDPNDHWGIEAWCRSLPGVLPTETEEHRKAGKWLYSGAIVDSLARHIADIAKPPPTWRGDWALLGEWLTAGHDIDAILEIVTDISGRVDCVTSLRLFDERVRRLPRPNLKYLEALARKSA